MSHNHISLLPKFKISQDKYYRTELSYDICQAIPKGKKYLLYFVIYNKIPSAILYQIDQYKNIIHKSRRISCCFSNMLCSGTLLYGTLITKFNQDFFCLEDIIYYKSYKVYHSIFSKKLNIYNHLFKYEVNQVKYNQNDIIIGLPMMVNVGEKFKNLTYEVYGIKYILKNERVGYMKTKFKINTMATFLVKPGTQADEYFLYDNKNDYISNAYIGNYKISDMMNKIFRIYKDVDNFEESDDEDFFENISDEKYIKTKEQKMLFEYSEKGWIPVNITNSDITSSTILLNIDSK